MLSGGYAVGCSRERSHVGTLLGSVPIQAKTRSEGAWVLVGLSLFREAPAATRLESLNGDGAGAVVRGAIAELSSVV